MKTNTKSLAIGGWFFLANLALVTADSREDYNRNWPQWRGPVGNGLVLHGDPPLEWNEDKNIRWKVEIPGNGHSTPVIWGNQIFVLTAIPTSTGEEMRFTTLCLDRRSGSVLWERVGCRDKPHQDIQRTNTHSSGSPVTDGERVYASFGSNGLFCYDFDGNLVWEKDLGKVDVTWGEASSPALTEHALIVIQDNNVASYVYAFDKRTGNQLWKTARDEGSSWTTPYIFERDGNTQVIINGSTAVRSYDPKTGGVFWQCSGLGRNVTPMIVEDGEVVYAMSGQRTSPRAMAIRLGGSGDLTDTDAVLWQTSRGTPYASSPLLYDGLLFFVQHKTSIFTCLDASTGQPHFSQERLEGITEVYASPIGVNDRVYLAGREGTTLVIEKSKALKILASNRLEDGFSASPAVMGNELYLRGHQNLYCIARQ